jgi:hypothetical protein
MYLEVFNTAWISAFATITLCSPLLPVPGRQQLLRWFAHKMYTIYSWTGLFSRYGGVQAPNPTVEIENGK